MTEAQASYLRTLCEEAGYQGRMKHPALRSCKPKPDAGTIRGRDCRATGQTRSMPGNFGPVEPSAALKVSRLRKNLH